MSFINKLRTILPFSNRFQLLADAILFRQTRLSVHRFGEIEAIIDRRAADAGSIRTCLGTSMYRDFLSHIDRKTESMIVLDIGANVGGFSLLLKSQGYNLKKLICVELNPRTFIRLQFNIAYNFYPSTEYHLVNTALTGDGREVHVNLGIGSTGDSIYKESDSDPIGISINGITLNSIFDQFVPKDKTVDICKIDIEGAENEVFSSAMSSAISRSRYLIMEIHHAELYDSLAKDIARHGFVLLSQELSSNRCGVHLFKNTSFN